MKRNWPFASWSHRIPTNAVFLIGLAALPPQPQTSVLIHEKQGRGCARSQSFSTSRTSKYRIPSPHFLLEVNLLPWLTKFWESPLKGFPLTGWSGLLVLKRHQVNLLSCQKCILKSEWTDSGRTVQPWESQDKGSRALGLGWGVVGERWQRRGVCV